MTRSAVFQVLCAIHRNKQRVRRMKRRAPSAAEDGTPEPALRAEPLCEGAKRPRLFDNDEDDDTEDEQQQNKKEHVVLTREDLREIIKIATERHTRNEAANVRERKSVARNGLVLGIQGMIGEWVLYKKFGLPLEPLYDTTPRCFKGDTRRDATLEGKVIEVKTTYAHGFPIRVETREAKKPADYYALVTAVRKDRDAPFVETEHVDCIFHGFVPAARLLQPKNLCTWGSTGVKYYCLRNSAFRPWGVFPHKGVVARSAPAGQ